MGFEKKTLIVFDTNFLIVSAGRGISYNSFEFNLSFDTIENFIDLHNLSENVILAIPKLVIEEMKKRKLYHYKIDCIELENKFRPFADFKEASLIIPRTETEYERLLENLIDEYLREIKVEIVEYPKNECFKNIVARAIDKKRPFRVSASHSDSGFKDVVIWESILNYKRIEEYTKVILLTADNRAFDDHCVCEFESRFGRDMVILDSGEKVLKELSEDYDIVIEKDKYLRFAKGSYFIDLLDSELANKAFIIIEDSKFTITRYDIVDQCKSLEEDENEFSEKTGFYIINSLIAIYYTEKNVEMRSEFTAKTYIDEVTEIQSIEYELELI